MKSNQINKKYLYIIDLLVFVILVTLDRVSKYFAVSRLKGHPSKPVISGILEFHYLENEGAAFGLLKNQRLLFILVGVIILLTIIYAIYKAAPTKKSVPQNIFLVLIACGSVGNFIDRIYYGYVIDFVYFSSINFPVFNIADIYVSIGTILLIIFMLFYYKEHDLLYMEFKERKLRDINK